MIHSKLLIIEQGDCAFCGKKITEPICGKCLLGGSIILKNELRFSRNKRIINHMLKDIESVEENPLCMVCKKREVSICPSCFYLEFGDILFPIKVEDNYEQFIFS